MVTGTAGEPEGRGYRALSGHIADAGTPGSELRLPLRTLLSCGGAAELPHPSAGGTLPRLGLGLGRDASPPGVEASVDGALLLSFTVCCLTPREWRWEARPEL